MKRSVRGELAEPLLLTIILLIYSNVVGWLAARRGVAASQGPFKVTNPILLVILILMVSRQRRQSPRATLAQLGLGKDRATRSILIGAGVGMALSLPPLLFFARPMVLDTPVEYGPVSSLSQREITRLLLFDLAVGVGLCEEAFFRGLLEESWGRVLPPLGAVAASAATFAGWHIVVTIDTLGQTNVLDAAKLPEFIRPFTRPIALVGGLATTAVAGAIFSAVKARTDSLWGAAVAHWLVDGIMIAALWRRGQLTSRTSDSNSL